MAAVTITPTTITNGYNLTDSADFSTLVAGAGNGVTFSYTKPGLIVLKNDTGGAAVFTIKSRTVTELSEAGLTTPDSTVNVANNKTYVLPVEAIYNGAGNKITIECDVAGKVLPLIGF